MRLTGYHHLTAITGDARANHAFCTGVLGLRLVKRSVNQDQVASWHLIYGDAAGTPGTGLTFFEWARPAERRGTSAIVRIGLRVPADSLGWWADRLAAAGLPVAAPDSLLDRPGVDFEDSRGLRYRLVGEDAVAGAGWQAWSGSPVPAERQIRGLGAVQVSAHDPHETGWMLTTLLGMQRGGEGASATGAPLAAYAMAGAGPGAELLVLSQPDLPPARAGIGGIHHLAFRTPDEAGTRAWEQRLAAGGVNVSDQIDRVYFRSLYFREPSGSLFEIATDGPGFAVDEPTQTLGTRLMLPLRLERQRAEIEESLTSLD